MLFNKQEWPIINPPQGMHGRNPSVSIHRRGASLTLAPGEATLEEEEDVSRGDILDFMTPRDISKARYEQHHEWMEEILESHYATKNIIPSDLGLGRKGELESLTRGFFDVPVMPFLEQRPPSAQANTDKMKNGDVADFRRKASQKIAQMQEELEIMKRKHARRMDRFQKASILSSAEKRLRTAQSAADRSDDSQSTDDIVAEVEELWGTNVERVSNVKLVEKGGLEERNVDVAPLSRTVVSPIKSLFSSSDSIPPALIQSSEELTPSQKPQDKRESLPIPGVISGQTPQVSADALSIANQAGRSPFGTAVDSPSQQTTVATEQRSEQDQEADELGADIDMGGLDDQDQDMGHDAGPTAIQEMGDDAWVMIEGDGGENLDTATTSPRRVTEQQDAGDSAVGTLNNATGEPSAAEEQALTDQNIVQTESGIPQNDAFEEGDAFDISTEFGAADMDTAGDALAGYGAQEGDLNMDTMEESAFGDAFHPPDDTNLPTEDS